MKRNTKKWQEEKIFCKDIKRRVDVNGKTFAQIDFIKRNILNLYEEDLAKYDVENREKASIIYKTIPEQLENKNSHF